METTIRSILLLATALFMPLAYSAPELKGTPNQLKVFLHPDKNTVRISGYAEEKAYADKALVNLIIKTKDKMMSQAMDKNSRLREQVKRELID